MGIYYNILTDYNNQANSQDELDPFVFDYSGTDLDTDSDAGYTSGVDLFSSSSLGASLNNCNGAPDGLEATNGTGNHDPDAYYFRQFSLDSAGSPSGSSTSGSGIGTNSACNELHSGDHHHHHHHHHLLGCQSHENLPFLNHVHGPAGLGSSDDLSSLGMSNGVNIYGCPSDIITGNSIDFYSNYYNFNDCLPSDIMMTANQQQQQQQQHQNQQLQQYTSNYNFKSNSATLNGTTTITTTTTTTSSDATTTSSTTEKRSVLMNLLLDGSDIGAGYTTINCRSLQARSEQQQQHCAMFKHELVWGNHS